MAFCTNCGGQVAGAFCTQCGKPVSAAGTQAAPSPPQPAFQAAAAPAPQAPPAYQAAPPYPIQPAAAARKTSPIVWILVVVLGLFVLGGIAVVGTGLFVAHKVRQAGLDPALMQRNPGLAIAKMVTAFNPDAEVLHTDDGAGTITVRDRKSGKVVTLNFDDVKNGRFHFSAQDENGKTATMDFGGSSAKLPSWIPAYPGSNPEGAITASGTDGEGGMFGFKTSDAPQKVLQFYQDKFKEMGMQATTVTTTEEGGMVNGGDDANHRSLNVVVGKSDGQTSVAVTYGKK
jgi:hypothetical protein